MLQSTAPENPRRRIKQLEVMVAEVVRETHDTSTLVLFTGNDRLDYRPGHFCTIAPQQFKGLSRWVQYLEDKKGRKEPPRAYSLASAPHEKYLALTIKEERYTSGVTEYPPLLSPPLVHRSRRGSRMVITGFSGPYVLPEDIESRADHLIHVCAGSGIVPNFSFLKHALENGMKLRHTLIYGNKAWEDVIFRAQLDALAAKHPDKLKIVHALSREQNLEPSGNIRPGRVDEELLREHIPDPSAVEVFACGPAVSRWEKRRAKAEGIEPTPRFMETVNAALTNIGVDRKRRHAESYG